MPQGTITYSSITTPKEAVYTQRRGVRPDSVHITCVPQAGTIAATGTVTLAYNATSVTLPNCVLDKGSITLNTQGFVTSAVFHDRRKLWEFVAPINGHYNETDQLNNRITATEKTLRELMELLLQALGESNIDVTAVDNGLYPEVDWQCVEPRIELERLCQEYGYDVVLNYGSEDVQVVQIGTGTTLPSDTTTIMQSSDTFDATVQPEYIRVCFGTSLAQARFELEAVALDNDGVFDDLDTVSYKPTIGWETTDPFNLAAVGAEHGATDHALALETVYTYYRIKQFSDGDLVLPDGSATTLNSIRQVFPVDTRLLEYETIDSKTQRIPARLYGVKLKEVETESQPEDEDNTDIDDELKIPFRIDAARGLVIFDKPVYKVEYEEYKPADLYLETSFRIRDNTNHQFWNYTKDISYDASGTGYSAVRYPQLHSQTIVAYTTGHAADTGNNTTNQSALDTIATAAATAVSGRFAQNAAQAVWYNQPMFSIRLDGLISEVKHIISDGDDDQPASYTIAARNIEFDRTLMSGVQRKVLTDGLNNMVHVTSQTVLSHRTEKGND